MRDPIHYMLAGQAILRLYFDLENRARVSFQVDRGKIRRFASKTFYNNLVLGTEFDNYFCAPQFVSKAQMSRQCTACRSADWRGCTQRAACPRPTPFWIPAPRLSHGGTSFAGMTAYDLAETGNGLSKLGMCIFCILFFLH